MSFDKLKIGMIASNWRPISNGEKNIFAPGTIISELTNGLVELGHEVTLFAPKDTKTKAKLISENLNSAYNDYFDLWENDLVTFLQIEQEYEMVLLSKAFEMADSGEFDLVHVHKTNIEPFFSNFIKCPMVITSHQSYLKAKAPIFSQADEIRLEKYRNNCYYTASSNHIKNQFPFRYIETIYHGLDLDKYKFSETGGEDMLFVGRIIASKGPDVALDISRKLNKKIKIIGDFRKGKQNESFTENFKKKLNNVSGVEYLGFIPHEEINYSYEKAKVFLMPIRESEAFGLVMIEAMACGTPVVAFNEDPVAEIIKDGVTGFICPKGNIEAMAKAVEKIYQMPETDYRKMRKNCRRHVEENFSSQKMINGYEKYYKKVIRDWKGKTN